jgi:phage baseplate assembly protein gpV
MDEASSFGDGAAAVFAFAAYHQLQSGQPVTKVILEDGAGHRADQDGVRELQEAGLASVDGNNIVLSETGVALLGQVIDGLKSAVATAPSRTAPPAG